MIECETFFSFESIFKTAILKVYKDKQLLIDISSHLYIFCKKVVLQNFVVLISKYLCQGLFLNRRLGGLQLSYKRNSGAAQMLV